MSGDTLRLDEITYSGIAANDIKPNSVILEVICSDITPNAIFGTVASGITENNISLLNRDGGNINSTITSSNHIVATWEGDSNMRYPPMVRRGEPVKLIKRGNQDKFYWRTTGAGRNFRTTDRICFEIGATDPTKPGGDKDDLNTYSAYLDSHDGKVGIRTSKANSEACAFVLEGDTKAGTFYISDDSDSPGNRIFLDTGTKSGIPVFQVNLKSGITLKFEGDNAFIKVPKGLQISAGERIVFNSPITVFNLNTVGTVIINAANFTLKCAADAIVSAGGVFGVSAVSSKIGGVLVAGAMRVSKLTKGIFGSEYSPSDVSSPTEGNVTTQNNSPDTDTSNVVTSFPIS